MKNYIDLYSDNNHIKLETIQDSGEKDVSITSFELQDLFNVAKETVSRLDGSINSIVTSADEMQLEIGVSFTVESGKLIAVLVNGSTEANMKILLKWKKDPNA